MAKNKVKKEVVNNDYFYEVCGVTIIILSIITLGELGKFGSIINLLVKILIGDYAFLVVSILLILGVRSLLKKKFINVKTLQFQGFVLIFLSVSLLSHLAIYNSLGLTSSQVLSQSFKLYQNYLKHYESSYVCGGGLLGAAIFQLIISLLGEVGIILIAITLLVLGSSFLMNTKLIDMIINGKKFSKIVKKIFFTTKSYFKGLKYKEKNKDEVLEKPNISLTLNMLKDISINNTALQQEINKEVEDNLKLFINQNGMFANYHNHFTSYCYTRYILEEINSSSYKQIRSNINMFFDNKCFYIKDKNKVYVEVLNTFKELLTLKRLLSFENKLSLCLGQEINKEIVKLDVLQDQCLVMCGDYNSGIRTSIKSFIVNALLLYKEDALFEILDSKAEFSELGDLSKMINYYINDAEGLAMIENISLEYERRKEILNYLNIDNYGDANKEIKISYPNIKQIKPIYVILNTDLFKCPGDFDTKLNYLLKFSYKMGIFIIIIARKKNDLSRINIANNAYMGFYSSDLELSLRITNSDILCSLNKKGDVIYIKQDVVLHMQAPFISNSDYLAVLKRII